MVTDHKAFDPQLIKNMVRDIVTTRDDEMDCPECYEHMDHFADLFMSGIDVAIAMPMLHEHLEHCAHCREEFQSLLEALRHCR